MLWAILIVLAVWVIGFASDVAGGFIHLLLVVAALMFLINLYRGRRFV
jgi:hypothetical protein